ncbi:MAG: aldehyde dehydrogenase family protein [Prolixibacteraceae bacterium]|jgi:succinate-semialdehyde dehydrogenase|nr:aldehyde dehydrogenase family protein [Prolixibacteraceae bacterium]
MEIKGMVEAAKKAQKIYEEYFDQERADKVVKLTAKIVYDNAELLAKEAIEETQMGVFKDKWAKITNKSKALWQDLKDKKSIGIIHIDEVTNIIEIAKPIGVVAAIAPMTNPVVTAMSKIMFALKTKNAIILSPHPQAKDCSIHTVKLILDAIRPFGVPEHLIQVVETPTIPKTNELMKLSDVIVATGGMGMVKSAYSSGKPSFGVGAGNVQVILDRSINYDEAAKNVIAGRCFDNGIICSGEQSIIYPRENKTEIFTAFIDQGAYIVPEKYRDQLVDVLFKEGKINREIVGQSVQVIAKMAKMNVPESTRVLLVEAKGIGFEDVICKEKMCPVMAALPYDSFEEAVDIAVVNLTMEGNGHTAAIHSNNQANIIKAGNELSVSRLVVNAPSATTAGGSLQNGLAVTNTLGCGTWGNNSISENFTYKHLLNITRIAPLSNKIHVPTDEEIWA